MKIKYPKRLKQTYSNMKQRCYNPKAKSYNYYGGRGISICEEWLNSNKEFYKWALNNGYQDNLTIDRKDNNGNYEPNNCRWVTLEVQANNRSNNVIIERNGEIKNASQWGQENGISIKTITYRLGKGKDILEDNYRIRLEINGENKTLKEIAEESGIAYGTIRTRYGDGCEGEELTKDVKGVEIKHLEINGEIHTITEWADISGLTRNIILNRISWGWPKESLLKPRKTKGNKKYIEIDGDIHSMEEWCEIIDISYNTLRRRIKSGLEGKELLSPRKTRM